MDYDSNIFSLGIALASDELQGTKIANPTHNENPHYNESQSENLTVKSVSN